MSEKQNSKHFLDKFFVLKKVPVWQSTRTLGRTYSRVHHH